MQSFRSCPSMLVLHSPQVQGICWENRYPWSLLPTLHQECLSLLDTFVLLSAKWFLARAYFSSRWKESRWGGSPTPSVFLRSHPAYSFIMLGSLSRVWLSLNTSCRFLSSQFSGLTHFDRVRSQLTFMLLLAEEANFLLIEGEERLGKHYSGTARAISVPVLNVLTMPCLCKYCHFCHCLWVTIDCNWNILEMGRRGNLV